MVTTEKKRCIIKQKFLSLYIFYGTKLSCATPKAKLLTTVRSTTFSLFAFLALVYATVLPNISFHSDLIMFTPDNMHLDLHLSPSIISPIFYSSCLEKLASFIKSFYSDFHSLFFISSYTFCVRII